MTVTAIRPAEVDPFASARGGIWSGDGVRVRRRLGAHRAHRGSGLCTARFCADRRDGILFVEHDLAPDELSDTLAVLLTDQLGAILFGQNDFESVFTGIVLSTVPGAAAWSRFYRNSVRALESGAAAFAPIHQRATELVRGRRLLDLGSCFGFFPLRMSRLGFDVLATDLSAPTMALLSRASAQLQRPLATLSCDATHVPRPDGSADTVTVLHLLEHLDPATGAAVVAEALRLATRRVVVAVPFEQQPQACYGHVRTFDMGTLAELGARCAHTRFEVVEHHGGWLVLDRV